MRFQKWLGPLAHVSYYVALVFLIIFDFFKFILSPGIDIYHRAFVSDMVYGNAYKPFVYRALLPGAARIIIALMPEPLKFQIQQAGLLLPNWNRAFAVEYFVVCVLMLLSLVGFVFSLRLLFNSLYEKSEWCIRWITLTALFLLPGFYLYVNYIYDFSTLFLFTLGLAYLARRNWTRYLGVFFLGCLNKETTILLISLYFIYEWENRHKAPGRKFFSLLAAQVLIFMLIRGGLTWVFRDNPGSSLEFHLIEHNLPLLLAPIPMQTLIVLLLPGLLIFHRWNEKPYFLRVGSLILPVLAGLTFFFGYLDELRDYYEALPVYLLLAFQSIAYSIHLPMKPLNSVCGVNTPQTLFIQHAP